MAYFEIQVRSTNHPDTFEPNGTLYTTKVAANAEIKRLRTYWRPFLAAKVTRFTDQTNPQSTTRIVYITRNEQACAAHGNDLSVKVKHTYRGICYFCATEAGEPVRESLAARAS